MAAPLPQRELGVINAPWARLQRTFSGFNVSQHRYLHVGKVEPTYWSEYVWPAIEHVRAHRADPPIPLEMKKASAVARLPVTKRWAIDRRKAEALVDAALGLPAARLAARLRHLASVPP
jgi:hypothetical protein